MRWIRSAAARIVPSIISSASDNDPTTVASLAVIGSTTVYGLGWLVVLVIPMLAVVQALSAHIGTVCKAGLEDLIRKRYGRAAALVLLAAVLIVNVLTLAADLEGGGAALALLTGVPYGIWIAPLAAAALALLIFGSYARVERVLLFLPVAFLSYVAAAFLAHPDWRAVLHDTFVPHLEHSRDYVAGAIALLGTTLTAYSYVWQELEFSEKHPPLRRLGLVQIGAGVGATGAGAVFWFILIATGATLGMHHTQVQTAQQAASALEPVAGRFAGALFGIGLLGSALLAIPVLMATSAYLASEMFGWSGKLDARFVQAPKFYLLMIVCTALACAFAFAGIAPIRLLFISSIAGGIATPVSLTFMLLAAGDKRLMRNAPVRRWLLGAGWATTAVVSAAAAIFIYQTFTGHS
ncbi:MAG: NRAMP family divalent metal transporter [Candidatus Baltobacteraceae bacterium]